MPIPTSAPDKADLRVRLCKTNQRWNDWLTNFMQHITVTDIYEKTLQVDLAGLRAPLKKTAQDVLDLWSLRQRV